MVERDIRDHADAWISDVGSVEASAHADFKDGDFHARAGEIFERHRSEHLKKTGRNRQLAFGDKLRARLAHAIIDLSELRLRDGLAVDLDALIDVDQMRRGVEPGLVSSGAADAGERGRSGTFAV